MKKYILLILSLVCISTAWARELSEKEKKEEKTILQNLKQLLQKASRSEGAIKPEYLPARAEAVRGSIIDFTNKIYKYGVGKSSVFTEKDKNELVKSLNEFFKNLSIILYLTKHRMDLKPGQKIKAYFSVLPSDSDELAKYFKGRMEDLTKKTDQARARLQRYGTRLAAQFLAQVFYEIHRGVFAYKQPQLISAPRSELEGQFFVAPQAPLESQY